MISFVVIVFIPMVICQNCFLHFDQDTNILEVPQGNACFLLHDGYWKPFIVQHFIINGIVSLNHHQDFHFKFKYLTISETGVLEIGQQDNSYDHSIILEQIVDQSECESFISSNQKILGTVRIKTKPFIQQIINNTMISSAKSVVLPRGVVADLSENQEVIFFDFDYFNPRVDYNKISSIKGNKIEFEKNHNLLFLDGEIEYQPEPLFVSSKFESSGVYFKNSCLVFKFEEIIGVSFIDPIFVQIEGQLIEKSIFTAVNENEGRLSTVEIKAESKFNSFINIKKVRFFSEYKFIKNVLLNVSLVRINSTNVLKENNYFINSRIKVKSKDPEQKFGFFFLSNSILIIKLLNQASSELTIFEAWIINSSQIQFDVSLARIFIKRSVFIAGSLSLIDNCLVEEFNFIQTYIYVFRGKYFFLEINQDESRQLNSIYSFSNCVISGYFKTLFYSSNQELISNSGQLINWSCIGQNIPIIIVISEDTIINSLHLGDDRENQQLQLIMTPCYFLQFNYSSTIYTMQDIASYNNHYPHLMKQMYRYFGPQQYLMKKIPSYYIIKEIQFLQNTDIFFFDLSIDNHFETYTQNEISQEFQIMPYQVHQLFFYDTNKKAIEPIRIKIQIVNYFPSSSFSTLESSFYLRIGEYQHPIQNYSQRAQNGENEHLAISLKLENQFDRIQFSWKSALNGKFETQISVDLCDLQQYSTLSTCLQECDRLKLKDKYCLDACPQGSFYNSDKLSCELCRDGCKLCSNQNDCEECLGGFLKIGQACLVGCKENEYYQSKICFKCQESCLHCLNHDQCSVCSQEGEINPSCYSCMSGFYYDNNKCLKCHPLCSQCFGPSIFECIQCKEGTFERLGQCIR